MDETEPPKPKRGMSILGWVILAGIVVVLIGGILPVIGIVRDLEHKRPMCGKLQSQLIGALYAYASQNGNDAWVPPNLTFDASATGAARGRAVTVRLLEAVAVTLHIPNSLFRCPSSYYEGPSHTIKPNPHDPMSKWGWGDGYGISYAFDWAAPFEADSQRVLMADRDTKAHGNGVMVVFGDAHVKKLKVVESVFRGQGIMVTEGLRVSPSATGTQPDDDIFSTEGDAGDPLTPGKGDPLRAWVK